MNASGYLRFTVMLALLVALFMGIGFFLAGTTGLIVATGFALVLNLFSYYHSDKVVRRMYHAEEAAQERFPQYHETVEALAKSMELPKPDLYVIETEHANAFATGRNPENGAICVTAGLLTHLTEEELEGVLAHELAHIKNRDIAISTAVATIVGAISMIGNMLFWQSAFGGRRTHPALIIVGIVVAPLAATLLQLAISRSREYLADRTGAQYTAPGYLASALQKIEQVAEQKPLQGGSPGTAHLFIANPFRKMRLARLFSTHPPTEERVERLRNL